MLLKLVSLVFCISLICFIVTITSHAYAWQGILKGLFKSAEKGLFKSADDFISPRYGFSGASKLGDDAFSGASKVVDDAYSSASKLGDDAFSSTSKVVDDAFSSANKVGDDASFGFKKLYSDIDDISDVRSRGWIQSAVSIKGSADDIKMKWNPSKLKYEVDDQRVSEVLSDIDNKLSSSLKKKGDTKIKNILSENQIRDLKIDTKKYPNFIENRLKLFDEKRMENSIKNKINKIHFTSKLNPDNFYGKTQDLYTSETANFAALKDFVRPFLGYILQILMYV